MDSPDLRDRSFMQEKKPKGGGHFQITAGLRLLLHQAGALTQLLGPDRKERNIGERNKGVIPEGGGTDPSRAVFRWRPGLSG